MLFITASGISGQNFERFDGLKNNFFWPKNNASLWPFTSNIVQNLTFKMPVINISSNFYRKNIFIFRILPSQSILISGIYKKSSLDRCEK